MAIFIAKAVKEDAYPEYCKLKSFHKEIVMAGKMEEKVNTGFNLDDIAKMAAEDVKGLMELLDVCQGCAYLSSKQCNGATYKQ